MRSKTKNKPTFPLPPFFPGSNSLLCSWLFYLPAPPSSAGEWGMELAVSPLPTPSSLTLVSAGMFLSWLCFFLLYSPTAAAQLFFNPFLNTLLQRHHHLYWWAQPFPAVGPLEPAVPGCVQHGAASAYVHRGPTEATPQPPLPAHGSWYRVQTRRNQLHWTTHIMILNIFLAVAQSWSSLFCLVLLKCLWKYLLAYW